MNESSDEYRYVVISKSIAGTIISQRRIFIKLFSMKNNVLLPTAASTTITNAGTTKTNAPSPTTTASNNNIFHIFTFSSVPVMQTES